MKIKLVNRVYDDDGNECKEGDLVLIQGNDLPEIVVATINKIESRNATFVIDDSVYGYMPKKYRVEDVISIKKYGAK